MTDEEPQETLDTHPHVPLFEEETSARAAPGASLDERLYRLIEPLGKGGMGEVYRAGDPALERDLAVKVMKAELHGIAEAEGRFLREARITGSLQHPGIVPVHNLGRLLDGRLHYTMRLVRGRTFADILKDEAGKSEHLPMLLGIFEKICQAVAYAHSKGVIHRDLKPSNVMVGSFGEVQVMDWGLAKLLTSGERGRVSVPSGERGRVSAPREGAPREENESGAAIRPESTKPPSQLTRTGSGMGTPAFMPPEQALGQWDAVDERADVFALGSILCQILTGQPAYGGSDIDEVFDRAQRGNIAEAWERLDECGADEALKTLCRECLSPQRANRPRSAAVVAERMAAYTTAVQERLRQAELQRVAAEARTQEAYGRIVAERRARHRLLALAAAALLMLSGGGAVAWWMQQVRQTALARQSRAEQQALEILEQAGRQLNEGWRLNDADRLKEVNAEVERASDIADSGGASAEVRLHVADFRSEAQERFRRVEKNNDLLAALLDTATPRETNAGQSKDEQYAAAFRRWGLEVDRQAEEETAARLQQEPEAVLHAAIAGLDAWMFERRRLRRAEAEWRRLLGVVERLDPNERRRQLRTFLIGEASYRAESIVRGIGLMAGPSVWLAVWDVKVGNAVRRLRQLRGQMNAAEEPVLTVLLLAYVSMSWGDLAGAEEVLRQALARRPDEAALLHALASVLLRQGPSPEERWDATAARGRLAEAWDQQSRMRLAEAIGCYRAARAKQRRLGIALAEALGEAGQIAEGEAVLRDLIRQQPKDAETVFHLGFYLHYRAKYAEAEAIYRQAIALQPDYAAAHLALGQTLFRQRKPVEAESACRQAIALKPDYAAAYITLGNALAGQGKLAASEAAYRQAIALKPDDALAYSNLAGRLARQGKLAEAETACRQAIAHQPNYADAYYNLAEILRLQGKLTEAETAYRQTIALKPNDAEAICDLGQTLRLQGRFAESLQAYRRGHELGSKQLGWRHPSLEWLRDAERAIELDKKIPAILKGVISPANGSEAVSLAQMCQQPYQKRYAASARLYADAFALDRRLATDLRQQHRYNAARSAALAAAGQGEDAAALSDKTAVMFRRWSLGWLRDDLTTYAKLAQGNNPVGNRMILERLMHWRSDADLASVRDPSALDRLPDNERAAWQALWRDVDELAKRTAKTDETRDARKKAKP